MSLKKNFKKRSFRIIFLLAVIIFIKILATNSSWVERYYTEDFFRWFANLYRSLTGWVPFSIGDIFYLLAGLWLIYKIIIFVARLFKKKIKRKSLINSLAAILQISMVIYIIFNIFWGLNYNRKGIADQLNLVTVNYDSNDLKNIEQLLLRKVNESKQALVKQHAIYPSNKELFARAYNCYQQTVRLYPFIKYQSPSVKSSLFGRAGNYLGFTGYYNPFSGEAQVNTTVPKFILPYTTCHEVAHQLGYAKEDEANFVGYLSATSSSDTLFHYSTYLDLFVYANTEVFFIDSVSAKQTLKQLIPEVKADIREWRKFLKQHRSPVEYFITWAYGKYLKANQQPEGMKTYNEVIGDLISFYKKYGRI